MLLEAFEYKCWADERTLDAIGQIDALLNPDAIRFVAQQLNHVVRVEELFKSRLLGIAEPHQSTNTQSVPPLAELSLRLRASHSWFLNYLAQLPDAARGEWVYFAFVDGQQGAMTRLEILFHIINHATYHRGNIARSLDQAGVAHPADTYTVFIHSAQPNRRVVGGKS